MARSGIYCVAEMSTLSDEEPPAKCARLSETIKDGSDSTEGREGNEEEKEQSLAGNVQALKTKKGSGEDCPGSWDTKIKAESPFKENDDSEGGHALETGGVSGKVGVSEKVEERVLKENKVKALIQKEKEKEKEEEEIVDEDMEEETTGEGLKEGIQDEILHAEVANEEWQEGGDVGRADEQSGVEKDESGKQQENRFAEAMHHGLMEPDVEITEYVGTEAGFSGILKERYSDFLVYEIDEEGNIVHLTDTVIPLPSTDPEVIENEEIDANDLLNEEERQILSNFLMQQGTEKEVVLKAPEDKAVRAAKHLAVHREFKRLDTRTEQRNGQRVILAFSRRGQKDAPRRGMRWEKGRPKFCRFAVYKENIDTMGAVSLLAKLLRMRHSAFSYAGTKDKRAITVQHMAVCRVTAERLVALNRALPNLRLGNFHYVPRPLRLGNLQGNHFSIVLRNISGSKEQVDNAMCSLRDVGFINYYGMQRFGTTAIPTYMIGRAILRDQWDEAVNLVLKSRPGGTVVVLEKGDEEKASINDVVLPLPGFDVKYPTNCVGDAYQTWLAEDGLEPGKLRHRVRDYALAGAYRNLIVRPTDVTWKLTPYDDPKIPLMPTDMDIMEGRSLQPLPAEGALSALHLEFSLPPASYATMAVREVLKMDTSVRNQSQLNCKPPSCQSYSAIAAPTRLGRSSS
uniref:pseudouridylate synthase 7 homolog isoform X5 n=1 Tax=Myxine glutinosa TaxID=7769 RepID=UPI00358F9E7A